MDVCVIEKQWVTRRPGLRDNRRQDETGKGGGGSGKIKDVISIKRPVIRALY